MKIRFRWPLCTLLPWGVLLLCLGIGCSVAYGQIVSTPSARAAADPLHVEAPVAAPASASIRTPLPLTMPAKFIHPGLLNSMEELGFVKKKIETGEEPWKSAFKMMKASKWANPQYKPHPHEVVSSGFLGAGGAVGGAFDESDDASAVYTLALMWIFTDDEMYARKAVEILNAWTILKRHEGPNWYMMAQWTGSMFPQGAELIRATYPKWKKEDIVKFSEMLNRVYLPVLHNRMSFGNREFGVINALMAIGVFNDDRAAFAEGMAHWVSYVPSWIYLREDGSTPIKPDYWTTSPTNDELAKLDEGFFPTVKQSWIFSGDEVAAFMKMNKLGDDRTSLERYDMNKYWNKAPDAAFVDGLSAETFRDLGHCDLGLAQMTNSAEIAWHQGIDLYAVHAKRIIAFMELHSLLRMGDPVPKEFYSVQPMGMTATFEIAYNHYHNRIGLDLPKTHFLIAQAIRPLTAQTPIVSPGWSYVDPGPGIRANQIAYPVTLWSAWETLTHAELGGARTPLENRK